MKLVLSFVRSGLVTCALVAVIASLLFVENRMTAKIRSRDIESEKIKIASDQITGLTHAIEQYYIDFPDTGNAANNHEWIDKLAGQNTKKIHYLKVEKYSRDSYGRLVDPRGIPYAIQNEGRQFHVLTDDYPVSVISNGSRDNPLHPRFMLGSQSENEPK